MPSEFAVSYDQFRRHAQRFMAVVDRADTLPARSFLIELGTALADLYSLALMLPEAAPAGTLRDLPGAVPSLDGAEVALPSWDGADPAVRARLLDDVAAVYRPLKAGIMRMSRGAPPATVLGHWRRTFLSQWGDPATAAMRTIYLVLRSGSVA